MKFIIIGKSQTKQTVSNGHTNVITLKLSDTSMVRNDQDTTGYKCNTH